MPHLPVVVAAAIRKLRLVYLFAEWPACTSTDRISDTNLRYLPSSPINSSPGLLPLVTIKLSTVPTGHISEWVAPTFAVTPCLNGCVFDSFRVTCKSDFHIITEVCFRVIFTFWCHNYLTNSWLSNADLWLRFCSKSHPNFFVFFFFATLFNPF